MPDALLIYVALRCGIPQEEGVRFIEGVLAAAFEAGRLDRPPGGLVEPDRQRPEAKPVL